MYRKDKCPKSKRTLGNLPPEQVLPMTTCINAPKLEITTAAIDISPSRLEGRFKVKTDEKAEMRLVGKQQINLKKIDAHYFHKNNCHNQKELT